MGWYKYKNSFLHVILIFNHANIIFLDKKLLLKNHKIQKILLITIKVNIINKKNFANIIINKNIEIFIVYMVFFTLITMYQVSKVLINLLLVEKVIILHKYLNYFDIFFKS